LQKEWETNELKLKSQLSARIDKANDDITAKKEEIRKIEERLNIKAEAFYEYMTKNHKDWHQTIGKVCNEDILFRSDLKPEIKAGLTDTLYGISLELGTVPPVSKSIEEYQAEKNVLLAALREIEDGMNQYQTANTEEKMLIADRYGKQLGELKEEVKVLEYSLELADKREKKLVVELEEWTLKATGEIETSLTGNRQKQNLLEEELSILSKRKNINLSEFNEQFDQLKKYFEERVAELKERQEDEVKTLEEEKERTLKAFAEKEKELTGDKEGNYKDKGVDSKQVKDIERKIKELQDSIRDIDRHSQIVNDYLKDKRELFDKLPDFMQKKEDFQKQMTNLTNDLEEANRKFNLKRMQVNKEKRAIEEELIELNNGISYFSKNFRDTPVYNKYSEIIERSEPKKTNYSVKDFCHQLLKERLFLYQK